MDYSPSRVAYGSSSTNVEQAIAWARRGGIVTFCWHWGSPTGAYNSASQPWYSNFYTAATNFDVAAAMNDPNSNNYKLIVRDIDAIAVQLKRLQAEGIPVLWRPFHEADGTWFWWGARGAEPCKKLWALLYDRLTNYHKLNNLIWVWNSVSSSWYPGNNMVDIVSTDVYASAGNHDAQTSTHNSLKSLSHLGHVWVVWGGEFIDDGKYNSRSFLQTTYNSQDVLSLDEISGWKSGNSPTTRPSTTPTEVPSGNGSPLYGQCGGQGWAGPSTCASGTCKYSNPSYSQCLP
ncbi:(Trans)glycosidase [Glarea lozoyensis ATCC 20868]|uniref:(Trans)glycosidase n=1 Tax=Glarea lozoyensis (strain ATCC 20868 / MF5171) TaxID=1116229 RepID=S3DQI2_GLAL2|nr:(Trans)glycosidase [Glarea lozoyensis ATCC 20868]EPE34271.1 (Trans)glycosidase [Glarea lozoyensis ATCC 20868]